MNVDIFLAQRQAFNLAGFQNSAHSFYEREINKNNNSEIEIDKL